MNDLRPAELLRTARSSTGLSQRELASRANTAQSVVARIELGQTDPSQGTLRRLLRAAGFNLVSRIEPRTPSESHMLADVERILALTPEERLLEVANVARFVSQAQRA